MSNPQKVSSPPPPVSLDIFKTSPDPPLSSPQISSLVVLIRWPRPLCIYSLPTAQCTTDTPCIVCVRLHYLYTDLSIPHPPICPYYPAAQPRVIALLIISTQTANFKLFSSVSSQYSKLKIIPLAHHTTPANSHGCNFCTTTAM